MIRLCLKPDLVEAQRFENAQSDIERWVGALRDRGFEASHEDVYAAWKRHSEASCAAWLAPCDNDEHDCSSLLAELQPDGEHQKATRSPDLSASYYGLSRIHKPR